MFSLAGQIKSFFAGGNDRSAKARRNAAAMVLLKGGNVLIGLLLVPLTLDYVDSDTYGIWIALSSMVAWMSMFDIGINNGLKNKLTEALASDDFQLGRKYVSTTYAVLLMIFIPLMIILLALSGVVDWASLMKLTESQTDGLTAAVCIVVTYFCLNFVLSTLNVVIMATQRPADSSLISFVQQLTSLVIIFVLTETTKGSLTNLCLGLCVSPLLVILISSFYFYSRRYRHIAPALSCVDLKMAPSLLKLGVQFFIIQIAAVVQFQMLNFLIIRYYGATQVAEYNVAYRYFGVAFMFWGIITTPLWAASTDAFAKNDKEWIRRSIRTYMKFFVLFAAGSVVLLSLSGFVYHIWVHDAVTVPFQTSLWVMIYNIVFMFSTIFVNIVNGSGKLKIQTYSSLASPLVFLGLCFVLIKAGVGFHSVLIAAVVANFNGYLLAPLQCRRMLAKEVGS